jgi:hypothetical protein
MRFLFYPYAAIWVAKITSYWHVAGQLAFMQDVSHTVIYLFGIVPFFAWCYEMGERDVGEMVIQAALMLIVLLFLDLAIAGGAPK